MTPGLVTSVEQYRLASRSRGIVALGALVLASVAVAVLLLADPPGWYALILSAAVAVAVATWYRPVVGVACVLGLTILFEQFDFAFFKPITRTVPFFENISSFTPIRGLPASPLELLLVMITVVTVSRVLIHRYRLYANPISVPIAMLSVCLVGWLGYGLISGGSVTVALWELRGLAYFCLLAFLGPQTIATDRDVRLLVWVAIAGVVAKAVQGVWTYTVTLGGDLSKVISITGHEDAVFIGWMLVLLVALLAYRSSVAQRTVLLIASPVMLFTFIATDRRAAYVALALGLIVFGVLLATDASRRHLLFQVGVPALVALLLVLVIGWNSPGPIGKPARAIKSIEEPDTTEDVQSNYYRRAEEANLIVTIRSAPILGLGFGRAFQASGQLSKIDFSLADYIPHNEIMWLWAKMGTIGFAVFWMTIGGLIAYGCVTFRSARDPYKKALAATITAALVMQVVVSYVDLQLTFARNMVFLGVLVAILARLSALEWDGVHDGRV